MTELLEKAISRVRKALESYQGMIGSLIMRELEEEAASERAFSESPQQLVRLAAEARAEHEAGLTKPLDIRDP